LNVQSKLFESLSDVIVFFRRATHDKLAICRCITATQQ